MAEESGGQQRPKRSPALVAAVLLACLALGTAAGALIHSQRESRHRSATQERIAELEAKIDALRTRRRKRPTPADQLKRAAGMRAAESARHREGYQQMVAELRAVAGADAESWKKAEKVLSAHFAPMEKALAAFEDSPGWRPPEVRKVVGPNVEGTLGELRAALGAAAWTKFNAWRQPKPGTAAVWRRARHIYFLRPAEFVEAEAAASAAVRWNLTAAGRRKLLDALKLPRAEEDELGATLRDHFNRYSAAVGGLGVGGRRPADADEKIAAAVKLTEEKLRKLLGSEKFKVYEKWKTSPENNARRYFTAATEVEVKDGE